MHGSASRSIHGEGKGDIDGDFIKEETIVVYSVVNPIDVRIVERNVRVWTKPNKGCELGS